MRFLTLVLVVIMVSICYGSTHVDILAAQSADTAVTFTGNLSSVQIFTEDANVDFAVGVYTTNRWGTQSYKQIFPSDASPDSLLKAYAGIPYGVKLRGDFDAVLIRLEPEAETDIEVTGK